MAIDEDLSDDQIAQLLKDAQERLKNKPTQKTQLSTISALTNRYALSDSSPLEPFWCQDLFLIDPIL
jgi:hypothetical protein